MLFAYQHVQRIGFHFQAQRWRRRLASIPRVDVDAPPTLQTSRSIAGTWMTVACCPFLNSSLYNDMQMFLATHAVHPEEAEPA